MQTILRLDRCLSRHMIWLVLTGLALGALFPDFFSPMKGWATALMAIISFCSSLGGGFREIGHVVTHPLPAISVFALLHLVMPSVALLVGTILLPNDPLFMTGMVLQLSIPTAVTSLMWVGSFGGNIHLCLSIVLLDTILSPLVIPLVLQLLVGTVVQLNVPGMMWDLTLMVAIPATLAMLLNQSTRGWAARELKPRVSIISKIALFLVIIVNATSCAPFLRALDGTLTLVMTMTFVLCLVGFFLGFLLGKLLKLDFPTACTVTINSGMRNNSIGIVLANEFFPTEVLFPTSLAPLFSQLTTSIVVRLLQRTKAAKEFAAQQETLSESQTAR